MKLSVYTEAIAKLALAIKGKTAGELLKSDKNAYRQLSRTIAEKNASRAAVFSLPAALLALFFVLIRLFTGTAGVISTAGAVLLFMGNFAFFILCGNVRGKPEQLRLKANMLWLGEILLTAVSATQTADSTLFFCVFTALLLSIMLVPITALSDALLYNLTLIVLFSVCAAANAMPVLIAPVAMLGIVSLLVSVYRSERLISDIARTMELDEANERCRRLAENDSMTGILNRQGLQKRLEVAYMKDGVNSCAAILVGIDNFADYNKEFGTAKADECLESICNCIKIMSKEKTGIIARYNSDEFAAVGENLSDYDIVALAEQIRDSVETMGIPCGGGVITVSVGAARIKRGSGGGAALMREAEKALGLAKADGKNCVGFKERCFHSE